MEHVIGLGDLAKGTAGIANGNGASGYVTRDDATCSDHGALADGDAAEDGHRAGDPYVVTDLYGLALLVACVALLGE